MLSSSDCFRVLMPPKSSTPTALYRPISKIEFKIPKKYLSSKQLQKKVSYGGSISKILDSLSKIKDLDIALEPWKKGLKNCKERTVILKEQRDWRRALDIFNWFKKYQGVNLIHYNVMLKILGEAKRLNLLVSLFLDMQINDIIPDNSTYTTIMCAYSKLVDNKGMLIWVGDMYKRGILPDQMCIVTVIKAYKLVGDFKEGERVLNQWITGTKTKPETRESSPNLYTYNMMIDNYGKSGQFDKSLNAFNEMISKGIAPDAVTFNTIISICKRRGKFHEISKFVSMIMKLKFVPDSKSHELILSLCLKAGDVSLAENYFYNIKGRSLLLDILGYRKLLYAYAKYKMVNKAETLVREIESKGIIIDEYSQSDLTRMYINSNLVKKAWIWFQKWVDLNDLSSDCFTANINAFGEKGYISLAERAFVLCLKMKKLSVPTFNVMIKAYGIAKYYEKACDLLDNMEKYGFLPDRLSYNSLIIILSGAEFYEKASIYAEKMLNSNLILDRFSYSILIGVFAKNKNLEIVEHLFDEMSKSNLGIDIIIYSMLIDAYAEIGNLQMATKYLNLMKNAGFKVNFVICNSLLKLYIKTGNLLEALKIYRVLKSLTGKVESYSSNCMISIYSENSMANEAQEILNELKLSGNANEYSYMTLLSLYRRLGRYEDALRVSREMQELGFMNDTCSYNAVIGLYFSGKRLKCAIKVFLRMLENNVSPNQSTFRFLRIILLNFGIPKSHIRKIQRITGKNYNRGLNEWIRVINSTVRLDEGFPGNSSSLRGQSRKQSFVTERVKNVVVCEKEKMVSRELLYV